MPDRHFLELPTLSDVLTARAVAHREHVAFADATASLTFGALDDAATRVAASLAELGVRAGDRVAVVLGAGCDFVRAFWGIQRLGAACCALNPAAPPEAIARRAVAARPSLLLYDRTLLPPDVAMPSLPGFSAVTLDELNAAALPIDRYRGSRADVVFLQPTSGTSGESRLAVVTQKNVFAYLRGVDEAQPMPEGCALVAWVPPWHDLGLVRFVIATVTAGSTCHIVPPAVQTIPLWLETVARTRARVTGAPDFAWRLATHFGREGLDLSSMTYGIDGGEPVRLSTIEAFEKKYGLTNAIRPGYGLAEATLGVTFMRIGAPLRTDAAGNVSCGTPLPGIEIRIDAPEGETGEILIRGDSVFSGYFDAPEATAAALRDGWLHTGDSGHFDNEGNLYVLGRRRTMLKRGGAVLAPRELEEAAMQVQGVKVAAAVAMEPSESSATEQIVVAIETDSREELHASNAQRVSDSILASLGFRPDRVVVLAPRSIARTWNGKIRHIALRDALADGSLARAGAVLHG